MPYVKVTEHHNVYTVADLARATGRAISTVCRRVKHGSLEAPSITIGKRDYYSEEQYTRLVQDLKELDRLVAAVR